MKIIFGKRLLIFNNFFWPYVNYFSPSSLEN